MKVEVFEGHGHYRLLVGYVIDGMRIMRLTKRARVRGGGHG